MFYLFVCSAAKMALVGLCNTLAIEGARYNIHSNVIVPTAASRLTENILPPDFFEQLKPELIAPVVTWLCHEDCEENGSIIESAAGWASKHVLMRGKGTVLRRSLADPVSIEDVREKWDKVVNIEKLDRLGSIQEETANLTKFFSDMDGISSDEDSDFSDKYIATFKDCITFALGIGASVKNPGDLKYLYEGHENFTALPTQLIMPALMANLTSSKVTKAIPNRSFDMSQVLHGEQYLEVYKTLPINEELRSTIDIIEVLDKGKNAVIITGSKTYDTNDELVCYNEFALLVVNAGGFGGPKNSSKIISTEEHPKRNPDATVIEGTSISQAALYRLAGDLNPLHIDPNFALLGGFKEPILHGLASLGFSVRHVLLRYADNDPSLFKAVKARFVKPVLPGDSLKTSMWRKGNRIYLQTEAVKAKTIVISGAYVDLHSVVDKKLPPPPSGGYTLFNSPGFVEAIQEKLYLTQNLRDIDYNCLLEVDVNGRTNSWVIHNGHISHIIPSDYKGYDAVLKIDGNDLTSMVTGRIGYKDAERQGKINVEGDEHLAAMILQLVTPKTKL
ncbi:peroxisomal multifunctional enzyme type 2 [Halyomorpha halys]|uniref:peroxisomal multifunctional enzyme type 2 n=1 Tax=Halyomorpha halys TaxID=286706 RepID=UPI0006D4E146|nr:peroxisomal multifunctional enzyme type 2 [Halyomorpha halys]